MFDRLATLLRRPFPMLCMGFASLLTPSAAPAQARVVRIATTDEDIVAVRKIGGWYVAVGEQGGVFFSHDATGGWSRRFTAPGKLQDVLADDTRFVLVRPDEAGAASDPLTWLSNGGLKWEELRGEGARGLHLIGYQYVAWRAGASDTLTSHDLATWERHPGLPDDLRQRAALLGDGALFQGRYYLWQEGRMTSTTDLLHWRVEFTPGAPEESTAVLGIGGGALIAATTQGDGVGPVTVYRKRGAAPWQRFTPDPTWTSVVGIGEDAGWLIATTAEGELRVSWNGMRWRTARVAPGCSPRFARGVDELVFGGPEGTVAVLKPTWQHSDERWNDKVRFAIGPGWATVYEATGNADELFDTFQSLGRVGSQESALATLREAVAIAETGSPETMMQLAAVIARGSFGLEKNEARAAALIGRAAEAGHASARLEYAKLISAGALGLTADPARGTALAQALIDAADAEGADPESQYSAAQVLIQGGLGISADVKHALQLLVSAADADFAHAQYDAGRFLMKGVPGVAAEPARALAWLQRAAAQNHPLATSLIGRVHEDGLGVPVNLQAAAEWYAKAAGMGVKDAHASRQRVMAKLAQK